MNKNPWYFIHLASYVEAKAKQHGFTVRQGNPSRPIEIIASSPPYTSTGTIIYYSTTFEEAHAWLKGYEQRVLEKELT